MELILATNNKHKLTEIKSILGKSFSGILSLSEAGLSVDVEETGTTPTENARLKAKAYFEKTGMPTLAADSGLYIDGIPDEEQPGLYVRRVNGRTLSEEELIRHYSLLSENFPNLSSVRTRSFHIIPILKMQ